jgi:2-polyprenyl-6-methoxyphenol hydroxylase-like FAD-dependent oxidoreductase
VPSPSLSNATGEERTSEATKTNCCIVGGGPAGAMLSLLLARAGVPVTLLEAHKDHLHGLLLIGDAAHVMLPLGGVGINCAIADAVEAANVLSEPLRAGRVQDGHLAEVQRRRERLTRPSNSSSQ